MRSILLALATVATAKPLFEEAPAFPPFAHNDSTAYVYVVPMTGKRGGGFIFDTNAIHKGEMSGVRSRTVLLVEFMEVEKFSALWRVGLAGPCGAARKPAVPTRADLCYGVVDREIVATKCA